ncbi:MAG TPA: hypothetical protein VEY91_07385 [Candidatus Limnocylindria bacterium]|nr:hypothetical protein [Candidatus Limnocylindria bacterium]
MPAPRRARLWLALPLLYATLVFAPMLRNQFWRDDFGWITRTMEAIQDPVRLLDVAKTDFRLIPSLSFVLNFALAGVNPFGYYLFNLALHLANVALVVALARRLAAGDARVAVIAGMLFAGGFASYGEAVIWISARTGLIADLFSLAALVTHARHLQEGRRRDGILVPIWTALALLSKESAVALVPLLGLLEGTIGRRAPGVAPAARRYGLLLGLLVVYLGFEFGVHRRGSEIVGRDYAFGAHALRNLIEYLARMILPLTPSSMMVSIAPAWRSPLVVMYVVSMVAAPLVWLWLVFRPIPRAARFGLVWIPIALLPFLFLTFRTITRYLYMPGVGAAIAAAVLTARAWDRRLATGRPPSRSWAIAAVVLLVAQAMVVNVVILQRYREQRALGTAGQQDLVEQARALGFR